MVAEDLQEVVRLGETEVVELHVLAGGDVALAERREAFRDLREALELLRGDAAEGEFHAHHLTSRLALAVDALLQAEADELLLFLIAGKKVLRFGIEVGELFFDDRDDVRGLLPVARSAHRRARSLVRGDAFGLKSRKVLITLVRWGLSLREISPRLNTSILTELVMYRIIGMRSG